MACRTHTDLSALTLEPGFYRRHAVLVGGRKAEGCADVDVLGGDVDVMRGERVGEARARARAVVLDHGEPNPAASNRA